MKDFNYIMREKCAITGDSEFESLFKMKFPLFCGCVKQAQNKDIIADMEFVIAKPSGVVQLKNLIPLDLLYKDGHDAGAVGALWDSHHSAFADFVVSFKPKNVLEIGGAHGKLALKCLEKDSNLSYTIIEPNSTKHDKIHYIDGFFGNATLPQKYDCIVHSHTFEHIYEPNEFLSAIYDSLCESAQTSGGGESQNSNSAYLIFSLPNMQKWLENKFTNCLNYEHTIFLNESVIEFLLRKNRFKILKSNILKTTAYFLRVRKFVRILGILGANRA